MTRETRSGLPFVTVDIVRNLMNEVQSVLPSGKDAYFSDMIQRAKERDPRFTDVILRTAQLYEKDTIEAVRNEFILGYELLSRSGPLLPLRPKDMEGKDVGKPQWRKDFKFILELTIAQTQPMIRYENPVYLFNFMEPSIQKYPDLHPYLRADHCVLYKNLLERSMREKFPQLDL
jgi:hypothetical protein